MYVYFLYFLWFLGFLTQTLNCILFYEISYAHQGCIHLVRNMVKNNTTVKYYYNFNLTAFHSNVIIIIKLRWALFVTYTIIQSITSSEMCSLHLTHRSAHTLGAVDTAAPGEQLGVRCLAQGSHLSRGQFLPEPRFEPTTSGCKSNALSTRATTAPCDVFLWCKAVFSASLPQSSVSRDPSEIIYTDKYIHFVHF